MLKFVYDVFKPMFFVGGKSSLRSPPRKLTRTSTEFLPLKEGMSNEISPELEEICVNAAEVAGTPECARMFEGVEMTDGVWRTFLR